MAKNVFRDNVVVITGGSSGIGREVALQLAAQGTRLVLAARDKELLDSVAADCRQRGARAIGVPTDVAVESQCKALVERTIDEYGRLDTLINNAGIGMRARFDELASIESTERVMRVNYLGSVYCTYYALPHLKLTRGRIVAISSLAGKTGVPMRSAYCASKHAMAGFFDSLRLELMAEGVSVSVIYPGFVSTGIASRSIGGDGITVGADPGRESPVMPVDQCARRVIAAAAARDREVVMTAQAKVGLWMKLIAPSVVDRIVLRAIGAARDGSVST